MAPDPPPLRPNPRHCARSPVIAPHHSSLRRKPQSFATWRDVCFASLRLAVWRLSGRCDGPRLGGRGDEEPVIAAQAAIFYDLARCVRGKPAACRVAVSVRCDGPRLGGRGDEEPVIAAQAAIFYSLARCVHGKPAACRVAVSVRCDGPRLGGRGDEEPVIAAQAAIFYSLARCVHGKPAACRVVSVGALRWTPARRPG